MKLKVRFDTKEIDRALKEYEDGINAVLSEVGEKAVQYAVENGEYRDVTGRLRRSNNYKVSNGKLTIYNTAPYAEEVQNRGLDVIGGAVLFAKNELDKMAHK